MFELTNQIFCLRALKESIKMQDTEMVPYSQKSYNESLTSSRSNSPSEVVNTSVSIISDNHRHETEDISDDEISVGCPSPALTSPKHYENRISYDEDEIREKNQHRYREDHDNSNSDDYFKPLKRLKMVHVATENKRISPPTVEHRHREQETIGQDRMSAVENGVKSFSIIDILNHRPSKPSAASLIQNGNGRIVRPWDLETETEAQRSLERFHQQLQKAHQLALLQRPEFAAFAAANSAVTSYTSETGSDRSSSVTSDCCSPDIVTTASSSASASRHHQRASNSTHHHQKGPGATPLDALFQMTSKTFDSNNGESSTDGQNSHLNLFNNRQQPKKKRKSRTAFTNHQIFELEKRFLYQKYLSPADRDEIAASLGLSNAQVITWFQNRRAKLKRDMEELKKDVESAKILTAHKSFLENVQDLGILKKKAIVNIDDDCPKNLVISHDK